jgi:hypothetical protein
VAGYGRSPSADAVIKDPSGNIIDHAAILIQVDHEEREADTPIS